MHEIDDEDLGLRVQNAKAESKRFQRKFKTGVTIGAVLGGSLLLAGIMVYYLYL